MAEVESLARVVPGVVLVLCLAAPAGAEPVPPEPIRLDPVVVRGLGQPAAEAPTEARTLEQVEIERRTSLDLGEALRGQPGVQVSRQGGVGEELTLNVRGASGGQTLVLVDGIPVNSWAFKGEAAIGGFDPGSYEQVEIVRGPFSPLNASAAIGGVLRLQTVRAGGRSGAQLRAEGVYPLGANLAGLFTAAGEERGEGLAVYGSITPTGSGEGRIEDGVVQPADRYQRATGAATWVSRLAGGEVVLALRGGQSSRSLGVGIVEAEPFALHLDSNRTLDASLVVGSVRWTSPTDGAHAWSVRGGFSASAVLVRNPYAEGEGADGAALGFPGALLQIADRTRQKSNLGLVGTDHAVDLGVAGTLLVGGELQVTRASFNGPYDLYYGPDVIFSDPARGRETRTSGALYVADRLRAGIVDVLAGARLDADSLYDARVSPRATAGVTVPGAGTRATLSYGEGFRAPSFDQLQVGAFANPDLEPEEGRSVEIGLQQPLGSLGRVSAAAYRSWIRNLVAAREVDGQLGWNNVERADMRGVELAADLTPGILRTGASLTWTRARDGEDRPLEGISEWLTSVYVGASSGPLEADLYLYMWSARRSSVPVLPVGGTTPLAASPAGNRLDLSASWWFTEESPSTRLLARVEDLLDRRDAEFPGFPMPGRAIYVAFELSTR